MRMRVRKKIVNQQQRLVSEVAQSIKFLLGEEIHQHDANSWRAVI